VLGAMSTELRPDFLSCLIRHTRCASVTYSRTPMARQHAVPARRDQAGCEMGLCTYGAIRGAVGFDTIP
jgi:hypothetical protein